MTINIRYLFVFVAFISVNILAAETIRETIEVHVPTNNEIRPHCTDAPKSFPTSRLEPFINKYTGFTQCDIFVKKSEFYKKYQYCALSGQSFEAYKDKPASLSCDIQSIIVNDSEFINFHAGGVIRSGWCKFKCIPSGS